MHDCVCVCVKCLGYNKRFNNEVPNSGVELSERMLHGNLNR